MFKARDFPSVKRNWQRKLLTQIALLSQSRFQFSNENNTISKLLFLSGAIVEVSRVCIEKYSFYQTLNETWCFFALCSTETLATQARRQSKFNENGGKFCVSDRQQKA